MSTASPYAEFAVQSNFSFLRGASKPEQLVIAAKLYGHVAMGLADRNTVAGTVRAWSQSKHIELPETAEVVQLPYHPGCRLVFADGTPDILAYPQDRQGWGHLCRLLTQANMREESEKGAPLIFARDLFEWGDRMSLAVLPDLDGPPEETLAFLRSLKDRFKDNLRLAVAPAYWGNDRWRLAQAADLADAAGLPMMAVNDVLYHAAEQRPLQDVLTAIRLNTPVAEAGFALEANAERHLKPPEEMVRLFRRYPKALAETVRFAESLSFSLSELEHNYPDEPTESGLPPQVELERLTWEGAKERFPQGLSAEHENLIRKELALVERKNYARYFLTVHDIMKFARSNGILCQGRGSAANSLICYCLRITDVGPDIMDHLLERFISEERNEPPDIDVDFEHGRRDEVIAYIYEKYSEKHTALAASVVSYRGRLGLREVAKALGLSEDVMSALSGSIWGWSSEEVGDKATNAAGLNRTDPRTRQLVTLANQIMGFPRHLSQHVGGFVITKDRLDEIVPIVKTAMEERKMVEWDKDDLDNVGLLKVDVLALGMLSCLQRAFKLHKKHYLPDHTEELTLATVPQDERPVYDMISRADTVGVFQVESRAQMSMLPRLKPDCFYDLVIEVAIVRPGPIQGDMVHPYLRRREGKEPVEYHSEVLERILRKTKGVPLFQEQAMKIAIEAGGFEPWEADQLRRAMATFRRTGTIQNYEQKMIEGMASRGYPREFAERCFRQIEGFGEYGFPESHAASFALLVYASAWFKAFYPDVFCASILNSQPMGFYAPAQLVRDAREHGVEIRAADINLSDWDCTLEEVSFDPAQVAERHAEMRPVIQTRHAVRLGLRQIKGLSEEDVKRLVENRDIGYDSVRDLWLRAGLGKSTVARLAEADAFRSLGLDRRSALWAARALDEKAAAERLPLFGRPNLSLADREPEVRLPPMPLGEHVVHDYRVLGLSLKAHPVSFLRTRLDAEGVTANERLSAIGNGRRLSVAGLVLIRQRPGTSKGVIFMTLEDETGIANTVVWHKTFERFRPQVLGARFVRITGRLQAASGVIHLIAERIEDLSTWLDILVKDDRQREGETRIGAKQPDTTAAQGGSPPLEGVSRPARSQTAAVMPKGRNFH
ncbi:error-prone DNA polymerase [Chelativorans salis]|uniref:Error-prone DNA polymerase n=1 Tax=Chelativorans salis TaxID=2978478 RepID=A0ABT2LP83_9HYPH|nr:error-prone DNA polymerase [Chelativorans sp. EGI FJ00035]MCT7376371.1 error-prone DNA polymerase [Chelativorans sp. EGI FJ00035]